MSTGKPSVATQQEAQGREVELKLEFDRADAARLAAHPLLKAAPQKQDLVSTYFDTPDETLHKAGVYLRIRDIDGRRVQTIKTAKNGDGPFERLEWEQEVKSRTPNLSGASRTALKPLLTPDLRATLRPLFETRVTRTVYRLAHDGSDIELAIDQGEIAAATKRSAISELELELKRGEAKPLFSLARVLAETVPLRLEVKSKAERGYELVHDSGGKPEKAAEIDIPPALSVNEAFRAVAHNCLRQVLANASATRAGRAESLHQMRIGLRRLRAALAIFAAAVSDEQMDRLKAELKWMTRELGPARELDVFAADVLAPLSASNPGGIDMARRDFDAKRAAAYARAAAALGSSRFRNAILDLAEWIETRSGSDQNEDQRASRDGSVAQYARKALARLRKWIKRKGADPRQLNVAQRHRLRIRAKRLRYGTEFFAATFPGKASAARRSKSLDALKDLQDALGSLNDIATHHDLIAGSLQGDAEAHGLATSGDKVDDLLREAERAFARFAATKPFWKANTKGHS
jgi:inorganic triphosphatase YgiF